MLGEPEVIMISPIRVIGIAVTTSNEQEMTKQAQTGALYENFVNQTSHQIDKKMDDRVLSLYFDYENGESGEYVYALGHQVHMDAECPKGCHIFDIPAGRYLCYPSDRGNLHDVLPKAWRDIWRRSREGTLGGERAFLIDFEFHNYDDPKSLDAQVDIYLSLSDEPYL